MGLFNKRKLPHEVFTPRKPEVNSDMYISRPRLEKDLKRELLGTKHVIIHGESGCGKSWLYKKVLSDMNINYEVINLANAARYGSITEEIKMVHSSLQPTRKTGYSEKKAGELSAGIAKGQLEFVGEFSVSEQDPVELLFKHLYKKSKKTSFGISI
ncbi:AAA family ATPase [Cohnella rhizosphaerae]|uniref:AAA family ATPase n=1 Tax=Cohnella rhizosphaerae TaxID=1457232 RepID=A0A9X4KNZ2_9BACL|nr:AAA family ATPase [Cohnella rhizosphaerae]MDG0808068.1 AAA family ATPase [Cohnella rhizosphaerae]